MYRWTAGEMRRMEWQKPPPPFRHRRTEWKESAQTVRITEKANMQLSLTGLCKLVSHSYCMWTRRFHRFFFSQKTRGCEKYSKTASSASFCVAREFFTTKYWYWRVRWFVCFILVHAHTVIFSRSFHVYGNATHINYACYNYASAIFFPSHLSNWLWVAFVFPPSLLMTLWFMLWASVCDCRCVKPWS